MDRWDHDDHNDDVWSSRRICYGQDGETAFNPRVDQQQHPNTCDQVCLRKDLFTQTAENVGLFFAYGLRELWFWVWWQPGPRRWWPSISRDSSVGPVAATSRTSVCPQCRRGGPRPQTPASTDARTRLRDDLQSCCCILHRIPPLTEALRHILTQFSQRNSHMLSKNLKPSDHS